jgi:hypothetical protein
MKKISFIALLLVAGITTMAQYGPKLGAKVGLNVSSINRAGSNQSGSKAGLHAGFLAHIHFDPSWSLQPELVYSNQGGKVNHGGLEHAINLHYLNLPILLQYNFDNGFRFQTGPQFGLLVDVTDKVGDSEYNVFTSDRYKSTDVSWSFGLGYLTNSGFGIDGRYNLGLSNISDVSTTEKNSVFQLGLFYLFDHKHKAHSR